MITNRFKTSFAETISIEYLAGFFDGEGCVYLGSTTASGTKKVYPHLIVSLAQSGEAGRTLLESIQSIYGGNIQHRKPKGATKEAYQLRWCGKKAVDFLKQLSPFLNIKKIKAQESAKFMEEYFAS